MRFLDTVIRAKAYLREHGRVSLRALKREFELDDRALESLVEELVEVQQVAADEGKLLSWIGAATGGTRVSEPAPSAAPEPERRQLTVMFCDLVGSADLSQRIGAEELRDVLRAYQQSASAVVARFGGHVVQYLGDGLLVYFGWPHANEDDAERAVDAGLVILHELESLNPRLEADHGVSISARVGIDTGPVVISEMGGGEKKETLALGDTPILAARLQGIAEPGNVVISGATLRLVAGLFVTEDRGTPILKGITGPIQVHRVLRRSGVTSRLDRAPRLTPFVGREEELALLLDRFRQSEEQHGHAVRITGEAGIGKSRLMLQLRERLHETPHSWLECRCSPHAENSALAPVIALLEKQLGFGEEDSPERRVEALEREIAHVGLEQADAVPLLGSLLSLTLPEHLPRPQISPQLQRQRTLELLLEWVLALRTERPLVLLVEDLHWIDPSTLEWLGLVIEQCPSGRILLLLTDRPEFDPKRLASSHLTTIALTRLNHRQAKEVVTAASPSAALSEALVHQLAARSDGIPLFVEELARNALESGLEDDGSLSELAIPETLQDLLMARLDRLGDAKPLAQIGATIGREFSHALLQAMAPMDETALSDQLERLLEAGLVYRRDLAAKTTYTFKHALVQESAYRSLLQSQRRELHAAVAEALEQHFPERVAREPEVIGWHCERADLAAPAATHYQHAGENAARRSAHVEAIAHLQRAIDLLHTLPEGAERDQRELRLQIELGPALQAVRGMDSPEVEEAYSRALSLTGSATDGPERFMALSGLTIFFRNHEITRALQLGEELLSHALRTGDTSQLLFAHSSLGVTLHFRGDFAKARTHEEQAIALYDPSDHRSLELVYGLDPGISALCLNSFTLLQLGYPDRALDRLGEAVDQARAHQHPYSLAYSLNWGSIVHHIRGEPQCVLESAEEAIEISTAGGLRQQQFGALIFRACALALLAEEDAAGRALDSLQKASPVPNQVVGGPFIGALADTMRRLERLDVALRNVDAWLAYSAAIHAPYWDAEFLRLKGEIWLAKRPKDWKGVESLLLSAVGTAQRYDGKSLELRAATHLARLWQRQERNEEARELLEPVYDWSTEGLDTADPRNAKTLLEELA